MVQEGIDGRSANDPLAGKTVNVKWYGKREGVLDINPAGVPDHYLVMTGPKVVGIGNTPDHLPNSVRLRRPGGCVTGCVTG